jgi:RNA polymerase sigma factor (sigma-70 family)
MPVKRRGLDTRKLIVRCGRKHGTTAQTNELHRRYKAGDLAARNTLVEQNMPLVAHWATRYAAHNPRHEIEDFIQVGAIGLLRAIELYQPGRAAFSTYATWHIKAKIRASIQTGYSVIRTPVYLSGEKGRANAKREYTECADRARSCGSLTAIAHQSPSKNPGELGEILAAPDEEQATAERERREHIAHQVRAAVSRLPDRLRKIMRARLDGETFERIGHAHGVTKARIQQLEKLARRQLAKQLSALAA